MEPSVAKVTAVQSTFVFEYFSWRDGPGGSAPGIPQSCFKKLGSATAARPLWQLAGRVAAAEFAVAAAARKYFELLFRF